ncbi:hypothetical protein CEXT_668291 [Caerostris extrusa]|uniref:Uncharacterized protein n=1 Tax=Caerostris extrusa TaxID=172846 RepID=A0AAV4R2S3_CAEEX|nr:hypothetical protein CEXT_668291 [Caerostris extrusa]
MCPDRKSITEAPGTLLSNGYSWLFLGQKAVLEPHPYKQATAEQPFHFCITQRSAVAELALGITFLGFPGNFACAHLPGPQSGVSNWFNSSTPWYRRDSGRNLWCRVPER